MSKKERSSAHRRKNAADPNQGSKSGAAKPTYVSTDKTKKEEVEYVDEKYIDITQPKNISGPSPQMKAHARATRLQATEPGSKREKTQTKRSNQINRMVHSGANMARRNEEHELEELKCWKGYKRKKGAVPGTPGSCVKEDNYEEVIHEDDMKGMSVKSGDKRSAESGAGLTAKGVAKYRRNNPGSKLKTAVTTPPSKLKPGSKAAGRRKSFCARSRGWNGERGKAARRRWNC